MKKGVLLVNLGSPKSTDPKDVKEYLGEFLMDERVIDVPLWARTLLVKGIILNTRPKKSAEAYSKIWWDEGSPLIVLSERLQAKVSEKVDVPVALAMRYGTPSLKEGLEELNAKGVDEVLILPLYPQFAMATTETILVLAEELRKHIFRICVFQIFLRFTTSRSILKYFQKAFTRKLKTSTMRCWFSVITEFLSDTFAKATLQKVIVK